MIIPPKSFIDSIPIDIRVTFEEIDGDFHSIEAIKKKCNPKNQDNVMYEKIIFNNGIDVKKLVEKGVTFRKCYFRGLVSFANEFENNVEFYDCFFDEGIEFEPNSKINKFLSFIRCSVNGSLFFSGIPSINRVQFDSCHVDELNIWSGEFTDFRFKDSENALRKTSKIGTLILQMGSVKGNFSFEESLEIDLLALSGVLHKDSVLAFSGVRIRYLDIYSFRNQGTLRIINPVISRSSQSYLNVSKSDLRRTEWHGVSFSDFGLLNIHSSDLSECVFLNTIWSSSLKTIVCPHDHELTSSTKTYDRVQFFLQYIDEPKSNNVNSLYQREVYRQLKHAFYKQGDSVNEQRFHMLEMKAYNQTLKWRKDFWTKLILNFSNWTSEYGQSIARPLLFLIFAHLMLTFGAILFHGIPPVKVDFQNPTLKGLDEAVHYYFVLVNPLHKTDELFPGWTIFFDVLMRISASYMIYNFIRASRRFIK